MDDFVIQRTKFGGPITERTPRKRVNADPFRAVRDNFRTRAKGVLCAFASLMSQRAAHSPVLRRILL